MKKVYSLIMVMSIMLMFGGCAEKSSYVKIVDNKVESEISVDKTNIRVNPETGLTEIQIIGSNDTDEYIKLKYRVVWYDKDGFEIESISKSYTELPVYKNAEFSIHVVAPNKKATEYKLFIDK